MTSNRKTAAPERVVNRAGKVLMRHPKTKNEAWFSERTLAHHQKAGWVLANPAKDDQPASAGDTGTPSSGGSDDQKGA